MASATHISARATAAQILARVLVAGESLNTALPELAGRLTSGPERALCRELCYGSLRWQPRLAAILQPLLAKPVKPQDRDLECLLLIGLYQLSQLDMPHYAAVDGTVRAASELGKPWARGLVNAVLRRFERERETLLAEVDRLPAQRLACPLWLYENLIKAHPAAAENMLAASNARPPFTLRVNRMKISREAYGERLLQAGREAHAHPLVPECVTLSQACEVSDLPGFTEGLVSVQDAGAQLAAPLLAAKHGMRVLDACAAPGGKTTHLLELAGGRLSVLALDSDPTRSRRIADSLKRLSLNAEVHVADAGLPESWWDGETYDRILLDAPCSGTGVIRRHPDIKLLRRATDVAGLTRQQTRLLKALWPLLKPGGRLLYATCSLLPEENHQQMAAFLATTPDAARIPAAHPALDDEGQVLTGQHNMDGFFYALLEKRPAG